MRGFARGLFGSFLIVVGTGASAPAFAAACNGRTDALGVSRVIAVDPREHTRVGTMQYAETLPLADHEVVITFDDGPLPRYTNRILDELAAECVKASFFMVGAMAKAYPAEVRRVYAEGHTIGTHSFHHPFTFHKMDEEKAGDEIDQGVAAVAAALGDPSEVAPFFRVPGLLTSKSTEAALAARGLMTWSADFPADDWKKISSAEIANRALSRIEAKGRGILLLHDIHAHTAEALPVILRELKKRGYKIVQVVPVGPKVAKTVTAPEQWIWHHGHPPAAVVAAASASSAPTDPADLARMDAKPAVLQQVTGAQAAATQVAAPAPNKSDASADFARQNSKAAETSPSENKPNVKAATTLPVTSSGTTSPGAPLPANTKPEEAKAAAGNPDVNSQVASAPATKPAESHTPGPVPAPADAKAAATGISPDDAARLAILLDDAARPASNPQSAPPDPAPKPAAKPKLAARPALSTGNEQTAKHSRPLMTLHKSSSSVHKHAEERHKRMARRTAHAAAILPPLEIAPPQTAMPTGEPVPTKTSYNGLIGTIEHELFGD